MDVGRAEEEIHPLMGGRAGVPFRCSSDEIGARQTTAAAAAVEQMKRERAYIIIINIIE